MKSALTSQGVGQARKEISRLGITTIQDYYSIYLFAMKTNSADPISAAQASGSYVFGAVSLVTLLMANRSLLAYLSPSGRIGLRFSFSKAQHQNLKNAGKIRCFGEVRRGASGPEMYHPEYTPQYR